MVAERTSSRWWHDLASRADLMLFVNKRIAFIPATGRRGAQPLGSILVAIGEQGEAALERAERNGLGRLLSPWPSQLEAAD